MTAALAQRSDLMNKSQVKALFSGFEQNARRLLRLQPQFFGGLSFARRGLEISNGLNLPWQVHFQIYRESEADKVNG